MPFLRNVTAGRGVPDERLAAVAEHYLHFGGVSPITAQNEALLAALARRVRPARLDLPLYFGNRNWHPFLADTAAPMAADGRRHALVLATSATGSYSGCRQYREDLARAADGGRAPARRGSPSCGTTSTTRASRGQRRRRCGPRWPSCRPSCADGPAGVHRALDPGRA